MGLPTPLDQIILSAGPFSSTGDWAEAALACPDQPWHAETLRGGAECDDRPRATLIADGGVPPRSAARVPQTLCPRRDRSVPLGLLRWPKPENVEEAAASLACLDDDRRVHQRREILRAIEAPDVAIGHLEEETALGSAEVSPKAQGCGCRGRSGAAPRA